jgi:predicted acyltransferase (DUF342 family)
MSTWFQNPTTANKLRQSYLKGFLDISGGGILVRADNSLNFYTTNGLGNDPSKPSFALDATKIQVKTPDADTLTEVPTTNLSYLSDLNENVKAAFVQIRSHFNGGSATSTSALAVTADAKIGGNLAVGGNAIFDQQVSIGGNLNIAQNLITKGNGFFGGNLEVAGSQIVNMNLYVKGDTFLNGRLFVTADASFHSNIAIYGELAALGHVITQQDVSAGGNLQVNGLTTLKSKTTITAGGLEVTGNVKMNNNLLVEGTSTVTGNATMSANLAVTGNATLSSNLSVSGNSTVTQNSTVGGTLGVTGASTLSSTLAVTGQTTMSDKLTISANGASITGNADIQTDSSLNFYKSGEVAPKFTIGPVNMTVLHGTNNGLNITAGTVATVPTSKLSYIYDLDENVKAAFADIRSHFNGTSETKTAALEVVNDAKINGNLQVGGNAQFDQQVSIGGNLNIAQNLITKGNGFFGGNLEVAGNQIVNMNLYVKGDTFLNGRLFVTSDASFHSNIAVYGEFKALGHVITQEDVSANGNLQVNGFSTLKKKVTITSGGLEVTGNVKMNNNLALEGNATISKDLTVEENLDVQGDFSVSGNSSITGTLDVSGASTLSSTLDVTAKATFSDNVEVQGNLVMANTKSFTTGNLNITDSDYNNPCHIEATSGNLTLSTANDKWVHITSNLVVDGSINFIGSLTQTNVNIQVSDELDISANGSVALKATQNAGTTFDIASFYNSSQVAPVFIVGKNNTVAINKAAADANICFDVAGTSQFSGKMKLLNELDVDAKLTARDNVELTTGNLKVSAGLTEIQNLKVNTTSEFTGLATFNGGINLGNQYIEQW